MALLSVQQLTKRYGGNTAVDGLAFNIQEGRCLALLGPNGAGKTTTLRMLTGLLKPTEGTIAFDSGLSAGDHRQHIGFLPQYPAFYNWMSGREFLEYAGRLARLSSKEAASRAETILERVGLTEAKNRKIGGYSGGMKQRLGLAQALIHSPALLILDEPVSALDPLGRREVLELMRQLKNETTILFSTHVLHDAEEISDDVLIMTKGKKAIEGDLAEVRKQFQQPVIYVDAEPSAKDWLAKLSGKSYVSEVELRQDGAKLIVTNLELAKNELLRDIVGQGIALNRFEVGRTTLEDLFMKVVQS